VILRPAFRFSVILFSLLVPALAAHAQDVSGGRLVLVLPFENHSGIGSLDWFGESFPTTVNQRLRSAGFLTITRDDRLFALDHLGLPLDFKPSRATTIRIAQTLDADYVIVGSYTTTGTSPDLHVEAQAQLLQVSALKLSAPVQDSAPLARLLDLENSLAWKLARQMDPDFKVSEQTFLAASAGLHLDAFESYVRGIGDKNPAEAAKYLQAAVQIQPDYAAAILALGKLQYANEQYELAASTLAQMPSADPLALEAGFYRGLALFNNGKYADAEKAFATVAVALPLPEVINNEAVAASRQGKDVGALFQRASAADPQDADYHYNIAVTLYRRRDYAGVKRETQVALVLHPADAEATALRIHALSALGAPGAPPLTNDNFSPLERIRRTYSEASFRQAAFQLDQMRNARMASLPADERAGQLTQLGNDYFSQGLIPEAEQQFRSAIAADPRNANAHAALARLDRQNNNISDARNEANLSNQIHPNAAAYLVLGQIEFDANNLRAAAAYTASALHLSPADSAAIGMKHALEAKGQALP